MREDLIRATDLVRKGKSYAEAAKEIGVTRDSVAGACWRAGVKAPLTKRKRAIISRASIATQAKRWTLEERERMARITSKRLAEHPEHLAALHEGVRRRWRLAKAREQSA